MDGGRLLTLEMSKKIYGSNHHEIYGSIAEKAESFPEAPFATVADIGQDTYKEVHAEKKDQPEYTSR